MPKSIAEEIRELMTQLEETIRDYDMELEVENWMEPEGDNYPETINLGINYRILGKYRPATWGDRGGEPAEYPELDDYEIYDVNTGQMLTNMPDDLLNHIEQSIWDDAEKKRAQDFDPPDRDYDRY